LDASGIGLALVVSIGGATTLIFGFRLPVFLALPLVVGWMIGQSALNSWTIDAKLEDSARWRLPVRRTVFSVAEGLVVATASTLWFIGGSGTSTPVAAATVVEHDLRQLRDERADLQSVLDRPSPDAAEDAEAARLERQVTVTEDELRRADHEMLCELDGTCGTKVPGPGLAYQEKAEYRDGVKRDLDRVSAQLEDRKAEQIREAGRLRSDQGAARTRASEIDRRLAAADPRSDQPASATVDSFLKERGTWFLVVYFGVFIGFLTVDWLFLALLLRLGRRRGSQWNLGLTPTNGSAKPGIPWDRFVNGRESAATEPEDEAR
jgi:hypothetical protein